MGVIDIKNVRYSYGKFIVKSQSNESGGGSGGITPEDMEQVKAFVKQEVTTQIAGHDLSVNDTHHRDYNDGDYPDVTIFEDENS